MGGSIRGMGVGGEVVVIIDGLKGAVPRGLILPYNVAGAVDEWRGRFQTVS